MSKNARVRLNEWIHHVVHVEKRKLPKRAENLGEEYTRMSCSSGGTSSTAATTTTVDAFSDTILELDCRCELRINTVALLIELLAHSGKIANPPCIAKISSVLYSDLEFLYCYIMYYDLRFVTDTISTMSDIDVATRWGYIYMSDVEKNQFTLEEAASLLESCSGGGSSSSSSASPPSTPKSRKSALVRPAKSLRLSLGSLCDSLGSSSPLSFRERRRRSKGGSSSSSSSSSLIGTTKKPITGSFSDHQLSSSSRKMVSSKSAYSFADPEDLLSGGGGGGGGGGGDQQQNGPPPPPPSSPKEHSRRQQQTKSWNFGGSQTERLSYRQSSPRHRGFFHSLTRPLRMNGLRQSPSMMNLPSTNSGSSSTNKE